MWRYCVSSGTVANTIFSLHPSFSGLQRDPCGMYTMNHLSLTLVYLGYVSAKNKKQKNETKQNKTTH